MQLIDAHCHLDDEAYEGQREQIIAQLASKDILAVVNPGCDLATSEAAVELARNDARVFACVGTHPHEAKFYTQEVEDAYRRLSQENKVVAIGEIGLDYHYDLSPREVQRDVFRRQLRLAEETGLPVVVHSREAAEDTVAILSEFGSRLRVLMHSFSEDLSVWKKLEPFGYFISLGGMVTFKNAPNPKILAAEVPQDRLLLETDGPYLAPVPYRGKTNLPWYAHETLKAIAALREMDPERLGAVILQNTIRFYELPDDLFHQATEMIREVIVVEGKDDVAAVKAAVRAECIMTHGHGFGEETLARIEEAARRRGIIILTDPDYAGKRIRARILERVPEAKQAYIPRTEALRGDDIGVENASPEAIRTALRRAHATLVEERLEFTSEDLFSHGLDGAPGAKERRIALTTRLGIGYGNAGRLLRELNDLDISRGEFETAMDAIHHERGEA